MRINLDLECPKCKIVGCQELMIVTDEQTRKFVTCGKCSFVFVVLLETKIEHVIGTIKY